MTADHADLRSVIDTGVKNIDSRFNETVLQDTDGDIPSYPYHSYQFVNNGPAPWETQQMTPQAIRLVDSDDPDFEHDVEIDYDFDLLITVSQQVIGQPTDPVSEMAMQLLLYWRNRFDADAESNSLDMVVYDVSDNGRVPNQLAGDKELRYSVDAQIVTDLSDTRTRKTIEKYEFKSNSDIAGGETIG